MISVDKAAELVGTSPRLVNQVIDQVQKLLDRGMWFSDACEVISILTPLNDHLDNFNDTTIMAQFWDFVSDHCSSPRGVKPLIASPMF